MVIWKNQQLTLTLFGITIFFGFTIVLLCFLLCPIFLSMIETKKFFDFKYITTFICALIIWILLMACACFIWQKRQKYKINNEFTIYDNVDESDYECCIEHNRHFYPKKCDAKTENMFTDNLSNHYVSFFSIPVQPISIRKKSKRNSKTESKNSYAVFTDLALPEVSSNSDERETDEKNEKFWESYNTDGAGQTNVFLPKPISDEEEWVNQRETQELTHEDSFKGLPEFDPFDNYLHLVSIDTPLSPHTEFFPSNKETTDIEN